jgi:hypothetical protein
MKFPKMTTACWIILVATAAAGFGAGWYFSKKKFAPVTKSEEEVTE